MHEHISGLWTALGAVAVTAGIASGAVFAAEQVRFSGGGTSTEVTVIAPRVIVRDVGHDAAGAATEEVSLTRRVTYADLDLNKQADVDKLEKRIDDMAQVACDQLAALYPLAGPDSPDCVREAIDGAMSQEHAAVDAAKASH